MARILAILLLILTAWAPMSMAAPSHRADVAQTVSLDPERGHVMPCDDCAEMAEHMQGGHAGTCLSGAACLGPGLLLSDVTVAPVWRAMPAQSFQSHPVLSSASLGRDVPPPRG